YSMTGGASAINQDICPFMLAEGNKAEVRTLNATGLKRKGFTPEEMSNIKSAYKLIFRSKLPLKDVISQLEREYAEDKNIKIILDFIAISTKNRGLAR
ncbi:MAG: acyl-ACP--UDP-N-acetylglucosamine O-acyltransferase, partial [Fusobacteriaceae bacterium]